MRVPASIGHGANIVTLPEETGSNGENKPPLKSRDLLYSTTVVIIINGLREKWISAEPPSSLSQYVLSVSKTKKRLARIGIDYKVVFVVHWRIAFEVRGNYCWLGNSLKTNDITWSVK
jgi:hypothetical protein